MSNADLFTLEHYREMIRRCLSLGYTFSTFGANGQDVGRGRRVFLRHDVDRDPDGAMQMGETAAAVGVRGTFFFLLRTEGYNVGTRRCVETVRALAEAGHEIGLHFNHLEHPAPSDERSRADQIRSDCRILAELTGVEIESFSMHNPDETLRIGVKGLTNAYDPRFFDDALYISDSNRVWKPGPPIELVTQRSATTVQVLVHPEWHGNDARSERDALISYVSSVIERVIAENNAQNRCLMKEPLTAAEIGARLARHRFGNGEGPSEPRPAQD